MVFEFDIRPNSLPCFCLTPLMGTTAAATTVLSLCGSGAVGLCPAGELVAWLVLCLSLAPCLSLGNSSVLTVLLYH